MGQHNGNTFPWGDGRRFNSYSRHCRTSYGGRVQRIPVDAGFSCPNRTSRSKGGCTYCSNNAFTPSYISPDDNIKTQLEAGKEFFRKRYRSDNGYFAYFQSYTNTFGPAEQLNKLCREALEVDVVRGIIISTRPDCLTGGVLECLSDLNRETELCVEVGVESFRDETLAHIRRGHTVDCSFEAFSKLRARGIAACAHLIFGLPCETPEMWLEDVEKLNNLEPDFVKFHQLQIFKGTEMETEFSEHCDRFHTFTADGYVKFICDYVERLSPRIVIERFSAEVPPRFLSVSNWNLLRHDTLVKMIEAELAHRATWQGHAIRG